MPDENQPQLVISSYPELKKYTGLGRSQTKQLISEGKFPKPTRLSPRKLCWYARDIAAWQAARIAEHERAEHQTNRVKRIRRPPKTPET
jgi:prophage regulatory protein